VSLKKDICGKRNCDLSWRTERNIIWTSLVEK